VNRIQCGQWRHNNLTAKWNLVVSKISDDNETVQTTNHLVKEFTFLPRRFVRSRLLGMRRNTMVVWIEIKDVQFLQYKLYYIKLCDNVSTQKYLFKKCYLLNWSTEIFQINKINKTSLITYQLQNYTVMDVLALNKYIRNYYTRLTITKTNI